MSVASAGVRAKVVPDYEIEPEFIDFGVVRSSRFVTRVISLRPAAMKNVQIVGLNSTHREFSVRQIESPSKTDLLIEVTFSGANLIRSQTFGSMVVIETTSSKAPIARVSVQAKYESPFEVAPNSIVISSNEEGEVSRQIGITALRPFRIVRTECSDAVVAVAPYKTEEHNSHVLKVRVRETFGRKLKAELKIQLELANGGGSFDRHSVSVPIDRLMSKGASQ